MRSGSRSPRMSAAIDGDTSSITTSLGGRSSTEVTRTPVSILPPWRSMSAANALGDRLRAAFRHHPSLGVRGDDQHQPDGAGHRPVESGERVRGHAGPERLGLAPSATPDPARSPAAARRRRSAPTSTDGAALAGSAGRHRRTGRRSATPIGSNTSTPTLTVGSRGLRRSARSIGTARRPNRRRADGHSPPSAAAT